jgi:hypothetical protein
MVPYLLSIEVSMHDIGKDLQFPCHDNMHPKPYHCDDMGAMYIIMTDQKPICGPYVSNIG